MRILIQRVKEAKVVVDEQTVGEIKRGLAARLRASGAARIADLAGRDAKALALR